MASDPNTIGIVGHHNADLKAFPLLYIIAFVVSLCASSSLAQVIDVEKEIYLRDFERTFSVKNFRVKIPYVGPYHVNNDICVIDDSETSLNTDVFLGFMTILKELGSSSEFHFVKNLDLCSGAATVYFFILDNPNWFVFEKYINTQLLGKFHPQKNPFQLKIAPEAAATYNHFSSLSQKPLISIAYVDADAFKLINQTRKQGIFDSILLEELYQALTLAQDISWFEKVYSITHETYTTLARSELTGRIGTNFENYLLEHKPKGLCFIDIAFLYSIQNLEIGIFDISLTLKSIKENSSEAINFAEQTFKNSMNPAIDYECLGPVGRHRLLQ